MGAAISAAALERYPAGTGGDAEGIYYAGLLLSVGQVREAGRLLDALQAPSPLASALRRLMAAVTLQPFTRQGPPRLASEWLAESYDRQREFDLPGALAAVSQATRISPRFGFAWARLAELEFCFGQIERAQDALDRAYFAAPCPGLGPARFCSERAKQDPGGSANLRGMP